MADISLEQAQEVHSNVLIVDGHNDTPVERVSRGESPLNWMQRDPAYHTDVPRMKEGGYDAGFFIVGDGPSANIWITTDRILEQVDRYPDDLLLARSSKDVEQAGDMGKVGILMGVEGAARWLEGRADILSFWYRLGIRLVGITHGEGGDESHYLQGSKSPFGPCAPEDRVAERRDALGLTPFGLEVLKLSNELGIVTDLAHINDRAFYEVLERSDLPVIMSHTAVFSLCHHWRCMTDDQIRALAQKGGVMGIAFAPMFIHPEEATVDRVADHVCYVADLVGIDHVGIGSDFDGLGRTVPVIPEVSQLVHLTRSMLAHGLSEEDVRKVWGGNFLRILQQTIDS